MFLGLSKLEKVIQHERKRKADAVFKRNQVPSKCMVNEAFSSEFVDFISSYI